MSAHALNPAASAAFTPRATPVRPYAACLRYFLAASGQASASVEQLAQVQSLSGMRTVLSQLGLPTHAKRMRLGEFDIANAPALAIVRDRPVVLAAPVEGATLQIFDPAGNGAERLWAEDVALVLTPASVEAPARRWLDVPRPALPAVFAMTVMIWAFIALGAWIASVGVDSALEHGLLGSVAVLTLASVATAFAAWRIAQMRFHLIADALIRANGASLHSVRKDDTVWRMEATQRVRQVRFQSAIADVGVLAGLQIALVWALGPLGWAPMALAFALVGLGIFARPYAPEVLKRATRLMSAWRDQLDNAQATPGMMRTALAQAMRSNHEGRIVAVVLTTVAGACAALVGIAFAFWGLSSVAVQSLTVGAVIGGLIVFGAAAAAMCTVFVGWFSVTEEAAP